MKTNVLKDELWKYEEPICTVDVRVQKVGYFNLSVKVVDNLKINENYIILFRLSNFKQLYSVTKLFKIRRKDRDYRLVLQKRVRDSLGNIKFPCTLKIEIIQIRKKGSQFNHKFKKGFIDIVSYLPNNKKFTYFKRPGNWLTIYYLGHKSPSIMTIPRYIKIDDLSCWNFGFYLAEGEKATDYRLGISNSEFNLIKFFRDFGENYFGLKREDWCTDIKVKNNLNEIRKYWVNKLNLESNKVNARYVKNKPPESKFGNVSLTFYNKIIGTIIKRIIYDMKFIKSLSYKNSLAFLSGFQAGDGGVLHHNGCIEFTHSCRKKELRIIKYLLSFVCSKKPYVRKSHTCDVVWMVCHRGNNIAREYILKNLFIDHKKRWTKLIQLYNIKNKKEIECMQSILLGNLTKKDIKNNTNFSRECIRFNLNELVKLGILRYEVNKKRTHWPMEFKFTQKGISYVNKLKLVS